MNIQGISRLDSQLNITPLIDVVFLLLIFYMLTSSLMQDQALEVNLPSSSTAEAVEKLPLIITIETKGTLAFQGKVLSSSDLKAALAKALQDKPSETVVIRSDQEVAVQKLIGLMDLVKQSGATNISIATQGAS